VPTVGHTDQTFPCLKPVSGKQVIHGGRTLKGFDVRVCGGGQTSYVPTPGPNRQCIKLGDVSVVKWEAT